MQKTLWINIIGFSSGNTGWVITDGSEPYDENTVPKGNEHGILNRHTRQGRRELDKLAEGKTIKLGTFAADWREITAEQLTQAESLEELEDEE